MRKRVVVLGASLAGLLTAAALAEPGTEVVLVDRDELPDGVNSTPRRGVPHGRHAHGLLAGGRRAIETLLPGATDDLIALGVAHGDILANVRFCGNGNWLRRADLGERGLGVSRPFLESYLRSRVRALPQVQFRDRTDIVGITAGDGQGGKRTGDVRIDGVRIQPAGGPAEHLAADLVVDATGRGSRAPVWLAELGYDRPHEDRLQIDLTYTSRQFLIDGPRFDGDIVVIMPPTPQSPRGGVVLRWEGGRSIAMLFGVLGDHAPTDLDGFLDFAKTLVHNDIHDLLQDATPVGEAEVFRFPASVRRRYERLRRFPPGFLVIGDAICSFNPAYGQGMSVAAMEAVALRRLATGATDVDARAFFRAVAPIVDVPWQIVVGGDLTFPDVVGERTRLIRFINAYLARLQVAAQRDLPLAVAFTRVSNLLARPPALLRPDRALRVLLRGRSGAAARP